jgi:hypothetical protein
MTKHLMSWLLAKLSATALGLAQVEAYEGQFEDLEDTSVFPPAALVAVTRLANDREASPVQLSFTASVYLVTTHIHGSSADAMLDLIDATIAALTTNPSATKPTPLPPSLRTPTSDAASSPMATSSALCQVSRLSPQLHHPQMITSAQSAHQSA